MNEPLQIFLLGSFLVKRAGEPVLGFKTNKGRALLAYLAVEREPVYDEFLASLLWPETTDQKARRSLNQEILTIRQLLGDTLILRRERTIQLNPQANVWLDLTAFTDLCQQSVQHLHHRPELCPTCAKWRAAAVALWHGEFLQGLSIKTGEEFDRWLAGQRQQLHVQRMAALAALTQFHEWRGEWEHAQLYAQQQLDLEPWREEAHRQLMRILARSGQRGAAIAHYQRCCALLKQELGIAAAAETVALYEQIRATTEQSYSNLPEQAPTLVGRQQELAAIVAMLAHPDCRLVTIVGLGGVGKTRLAVAVAQHRRTIDLNGVLFVGLSAIVTVDNLVQAVAEALQLTLTGSDPTQQLLTYLSSKEMLLVLDNFEHLLNTTHQNEINPCLDLLARLLDTAPRLKLLVTSRVILGMVPLEWIYDLDGLAVPRDDEVETSIQSGAVLLFLQRAQQARHDFVLDDRNRAAVVQICQLVEGVPLAIELAVAAVRHLSCSAIADALQQNLDLLATTSPALPERHRSVRATFDYSWQLLVTAEQSGLQNLAVFHGEFTVAAAQQVADISPAALDGLVHKHLVQHVGDDRYVLHDLVHQFAVEKLALQPEQQHQARDRHGTYYLTFVAQQEAALAGPQQQRAMAAMREEIADITVAWEWMVSQAHYQLVKAALYSYGTFYHRQGWYREGKTIFARVIQALEQSCALMTEDVECRRLLGCALIWQANFCERLTEFTEALVYLTRGRALLAPFGASRELASALRRLGWLAFRRDAYDEAVDLTEQSVVVNQTLHHQQGLAGDYNNLGVIKLRQYQLEQARHYFLMSAQLTETQSAKATNLLNLGKTAQFAEMYGEAEAYRRQAQAMFEQVENQHGLGVCLANLGHDLLFQGKLDEAQQYLEKSLRLRRDAGDRLGEAESLLLMGTVAVHRGSYDTAEVHLLQALALAREVNARWFLAEAQTQLGTLLLFDEAYAQAKQQLEAALTLFQQLALERFTVTPLVLLAELATRQAQWEDANVLLQQGLTIAARLNFREGLALCYQQLGILAQLRDRPREAAQYFDASYEHAQAIGHGLRIAWACYYRAHYALHQGRTQHAVLCFSEAMTKAMRMGALPIVLHGLVGMAELRGRVVERIDNRAQELLTFVAQHHACTQQLKREMRILQHEIGLDAGAIHDSDSDNSIKSRRLADVVDAEVAFGAIIA